MKYWLGRKVKTRIEMWDQAAVPQAVVMMQRVIAKVWLLPVMGLLWMNAKCLPQAQVLESLVPS